MISIVILTYNSAKFIGHCLDSIFRQKGQDFEVIIVDNGSCDGTKNFIKKHYPQVMLIENQRNLGPCRGRNQGIKLAQGGWILTLDCDVTLKDDFLSEVNKQLKNLPERIGMVQPKILTSDKQRVYSCGVYLCWSRRFYDIGSQQKDNEKFRQSKIIFGPCAAAALYSRKMLEELKEDTGYFDERFFFFVEDVDLAWRAQKKGWKALFCHQAICYHSGHSSKYDKHLRQYLCFRNRFYTIIKNDGFLKYGIKFLPLFAYDLPRLFYLVVINLFFWKRRKEPLIES